MIELWWDNELGWYAQELDETGDLIQDSMKEWFPVYMCQFGEGDLPDVLDALRDAFPGHRILKRGHRCF